MFKGLLFGWLAIAAVMTVPATLRAQSPHVGLDSASIAQLTPRRYVRLQLPEYGRIQGTVGLRSGSELTLQVDAENRKISLGAVDTLWVRGRRTTTGALIGAILGAGGGAFLGAIADGLCESDCNGNGVLVVGLLGAGAGAVVGGVVGTAIPRWRRIFPH